MTVTNVTSRGSARRLLGRIGASLALIGSAAAVQAENVLQDVSFSAGAAGRVDVVLQLAGPAPDAQVFTTDQPPRIAIDLPETRSEVDARRITVGTGATSAISTVEAAGRTRVVIDLFRSASYETRNEGNRLIVSVSGGTGAGAVAGAVPVDSRDPAKRVDGGLEVSNIDFRRTREGAGRVILSFTGEGAAVDMRSEDDRVVVDLHGVRLPESLAQRLDVMDFATPVQFIESRRSPAGSVVTVSTSGRFETLAYQTGNEYVIEIDPISEEEEQAAASLLEAEEGYTGTPVTFNFQDIPVRTVLQLIAEESGLNVVAADTVTGSITLRLINVPWDQAMDIILRAKSLDKRRDGNVVWVAPQAEIAAYEQAQADARIALEEREELITEYIPINYGNAEQIASLLTDESKQGQGGGGGGQQQSRGFLSPRGSVSFDARTNTLLLNDTPKKVEEIKALIAVLDRPVDQVLIEARIVIATETFARELGARFGISGGYEDDNGNIFTVSGSQQSADRMANIALGNRFAGQGSGLPVAAPGPAGAGILTPSIIDRLNVNLPVTNPTGAIGFALLGADYLLDLELSALENEGRGEVVSSPRVITANQREATIRQGDEVGYVTISPTAGGNAIPIPNVQFKEVLLELTVTPTITQDGRVYLTMNVVKDEVEGFINTSIGDVPQIATREINTAVLVDNGQTVVIGGVYEFNSRESLNKVPFLGDVPFLGNLFRNKGKSTEKAELLIFVTPKVLAVSGRQ